MILGSSLLHYFRDVTDLFGDTFQNELGLVTKIFKEKDEQNEIVFREDGKICFEGVISS